MFFVSICCVIGLRTSVLLGQTTSVQIPPNIGKSIVRIVIERARKNDEIKKEKLTYKRVYTVDNLNDSGQITDREKEEVVIIKPGSNEQVIERNGKPVNKSEASKPKIDLINILETVVILHDFTIVKIELVDGRPQYVISFRPKSNQDNNGGDIEDIIVRSEGVMYVDIEKFYIKRISARMIRPYSRALGMFNLSRADIEMVEEEFKDIVVMKSIIIIDRFWSILRGGTVFEKQTYTYKDYQQIQQR